MRYNVLMNKNKFKLKKYTPVSPKWLKRINNFRASKTPGTDCIPEKVLKNTELNIFPEAFNLCLS